MDVLDKINEAMLSEAMKQNKKLVETVANLRAQLAGRDAQLAAEREHKAKVTKILSWIVKDIRDTAKEQKIKGAELYEKPCYGIGLYAWKEATAYLGLRVVTGTTRQPTQDKGEV